MDSFHTIYEISVFDTVLGFELFFVLLGLAIVYYLIRTDKKIGFITRLFLWTWSVFWLAGFTPFYIRDIKNSIHFKRLLDRNECQRVEGEVHVLFQQPYGGHTGGDKIEVGNTIFEINYFDYSQGPTYHNTIAHHGALGNGVYTRIAHDNGIILKIEIRQSSFRKSDHPQLGS